MIESPMIVQDFREYLDELLRDGFSVRPDEHGSDPDLIDPGATRSRPGARTIPTTSS